MHVEFLTPWAALVALAVIAPLAALVLSAARSRRAARVLRLRPQRWRAALALPATCLVAAVGLVGIAAAQPVSLTSESGVARTDAEVLYVLDTSRSMLARAAPGAPTRFERARSAALRLRTQVADVPSGLASFTDRVLPYLLPTAGLGVFRAVLERAAGIDEPPPRDVGVEATTLFALADVARGGFFDRSARRRVLVVLTDGDSRPFSATDTARILKAGGVDLVLVRVGSPSDRIYTPSGSVEPGYRPDPGSARAVDELAEAAGGKAVGVDRLPAAEAAVRTSLGSGPVASAARETHSRALAPYAVLLALVPLLPLLVRRNLS